MKRRTLLIGGLLGATGAALLKPRDRGTNHSPYFESVSRALRSAAYARPTLVVDRSLLRQNVQTLRSHIAGRFDYRIVAKSLPSLAMLKETMNAADSNRLMLFHQPFINQVARELPSADILLGKPLPVQAAAQFYDAHDSAAFSPQRQLQWLVDTPRRIAEYGALADQRAIDMRVSLEIDIGLHRGGARTASEFQQMLDELARWPRLQFAGLMGYEPHIVKVPGDKISYRDEAMQAYAGFTAAARSHFGQDWPADVTLNSGGSGTYQLYDAGDFPMNELASGSCLVQPTDFDGATLADHVPAAFIAAPVLKAADELRTAGFNTGPLQTWWDPNKARTFFLYGGYWKAQTVSPQGLKTNLFLGRSTNQEGMTGSRKINLEPGDWVFLRPTQSEHVFLQFGDIAVYDRGEIVDRWPVMSQSVG
ncbi:DSD1 family PLP-dependent enzyme [Seongchinamella sediminis]|uniref:DSD1 family PLP-dependent enzyme n=1 Tax=Seongchinamella sediminis TaxID=2283635 RepID=A0A3L7DS75_9GAMM|nr:DSD1 family PLP-dependent enzyme [Seongchinamella sediminis]RLQ20517.1 DSD1 family PLP-dependent enzyme [Seongchinamella sediminis]